MKFNIDDYKGKYAMCCKTEEEARDFCNYMYSVDKKHWSSFLTDTHFNTHRSHTTYNLSNGLYGDINCFIGCGYTILEWSDFMNKEFTKSDLRTGDVVKFREGELGIVILEFNTIACKNGGWISMSSISEDLTSSFYLGKYDIVAVRRPNESCACCFDAMRGNAPRGTLVYERKEVEEMTLAEVCKLLGKEIKIVK